MKSVGSNITVFKSDERSCLYIYVSACGSARGISSEVTASLKDDTIGLKGDVGVIACCGICRN